MTQTAAPSTLAKIIAAPREIAVSGDLRCLDLAFPDDTRVRVGAERLRSACKCAHCLRARIDGVFPEQFTDLAITQVSPIGGYAINIAFSDGHARGIYPWALLLSLDQREPGAAHD
jgi:prepilin-type processing-associated H-X9-DG protein